MQTEQVNTENILVLKGLNHDTPHMLYFDFGVPILAYPVEHPGLFAVVVNNGWPEIRLLEGLYFNPN